MNDDLFFLPSAHGGDDLNYLYHHNISLQHEHHNNDNDDEHTNLSHNQYVAVVLSLFSGNILSLLGSFTILYSIRLRRNKEKSDGNAANNNNNANNNKSGNQRKQGNVYHRLLIVLSVFEIWTSITWMLLPFLAPRGTPGLYWALGNDHTCALGGFLSVTTLFSAWTYSAYLSVYFLLVIRYNWTEAQIVAWRLEWIGFVIAIVISWTAAAMGLVTHSYHARDSEIMCWSHYGSSSSTTTTTTTTTRGSEDFLEDRDYTNYDDSIFLVGRSSVFMSLAASIIGIVCTLAIYWSIYAQTNHSHRHSSFLSGGSSSRTLQEFSTTRAADRRLKTVAKQSALYCLVYSNVLIWPLATQLVYGISKPTREDRGSTIVFAFDMIGYFLMCGQGMLNCMVYLRPRYEHWRMIGSCSSTTTTTTSILVGSSGGGGDSSSNNNNIRYGRLWALQKAISAETLPRWSRGQFLPNYKDVDPSKSTSRFFRVEGNGGGNGGLSGGLTSSGLTRTAFSKERLVPDLEEAQQQQEQIFNNKKATVDAKRRKSFRRRRSSGVAAELLQSSMFIVEEDEDEQRQDSDAGGTVTVTAAGTSTTTPSDRCSSPIHIDEEEDYCNVVNDDILSNCSSHPSFVVDDATMSGCSPTQHSASSTSRCSEDDIGEGEEEIEIVFYYDDEDDPSQLFELSLVQTDKDKQIDCIVA